MTVITDWNDAATAWDDSRDFVETMKAPLTAAMIEGLALSPGDAVLELGAGTGELAAQVANRVGASGRVLATDLAPAMVELVARLAADCPQLSADVADATATGLAGACFDAVASRMTLMLLPDPLAALAEWHRVLRPGGRLAVAVWAAPEQNLWLVALGMSAMIHGAVSGGLPTEPGGVFSLASVEGLAAVVTDAGFHSVTVRPISMTAHFPSAAAHFAGVSAMAAPLRKALAAATPETIEAIKVTAAEIIAAHQTNDGYAIPAQALLCTALA
jgi:SAM-dependent methyltransferase